MRICIGDTIESEFGKGPIVALTNEWVVHDTGDGHEAALPIPADGQWWIPADSFGPHGTKHSAIDVGNEQNHHKC
jgi:hypothetical protein